MFLTNKHCSMDIVMQNEKDIMIQLLTQNYDKYAVYIALHILWVNWN